MRKRDRTIAVVNTRVKRVTQKYCVEFPRSIKEAITLDQMNKNVLCKDAIDKEMNNFIVAFDILETDQSLPPGWIRASGHFVFDVRMTLERKARWVKDGHRTPVPVHSTYTCVVYRKSVRTSLPYAVLLGLAVCACDI